MFVAVAADIMPAHGGEGINGSATRSAGVRAFAVAARPAWARRGTASGLAAMQGFDVGQFLGGHVSNCRGNRSLGDLYARNEERGA